MLANIEQDNSFRKIAVEWFDTKKSNWSLNTRDMIISYFERDIFPLIGDIGISQIKPIEMLTCLKQIENRGALEIAKKMRQRCSEVFQYAIITGRTENNPARELTKAMITYTPKNYAFLIEDEMRDFMKSKPYLEFQPMNNKVNPIHCNTLTICTCCQLKMIKPTL